MGRVARREVGVEGRLSVVRQRGQEDDEGVTKKRTMVSENLEWVCCCGQGHQEAKSPETKEQMHRGSAPDPERPVRGAPRGNPGKPLR